MGVNIYCETLSGQVHPDWDSSKLAGDRDFAAMIHQLPHRQEKRDEMDIEGKYRPTDFPAWRAAIAAQTWPNPGRFEHLMDILEADETQFIYLSW